MRVREEVGLAAFNLAILECVDRDLEAVDPPARVELVRRSVESSQ